jgi:hypothetical protein
MYLEHTSRNNKKFSKKITLLIIFVIIAAIFTAYFLTINSTDSKYINALHIQKQNIDNINKTLASAVEELEYTDINDPEGLKDIALSVANSETMIAKAIEDLKKITPPSKYQKQFNLYLQGVTLNKRILTQTKLILQNPRSSSINNAVDALYKYVSETTQAYELSKLGKSYISLPSEVLTLPDKVSQYAFNAYNSYESKSRLLEQYTSYFNSMDSVVFGFQSAKVDFGKNLDLISRNKISIDEIYTEIEKKLLELNDIQSSYNSLTVPSKLAEHHQKLNELIRSYTYYCQDFKSTLMSLEEAGGDHIKLQETSEIFNNLQTKYDSIAKSFVQYVETFSSNQSFYTDINNL